jgi:hypothetical protein
MIEEFHSEPYEKARSLVYWYCRLYSESFKGIDGNTMKMARASAHKLCDEVMRELWSNHQKTYEGFERHEYWKSVKQHINLI